MFNYLVQYLNLNLLFYYQLDQIKIFIKEIFLFFKNKSLINKNEIITISQKIIKENPHYSFIKPFLNNINFIKNNIEIKILWTFLFSLMKKFKDNYNKNLINILNTIKKNKLFYLKLSSIYNLKKFSKKFLIKHRIYNILRQKNFKSFISYKLKFFKNKLFKRKKYRFKRHHKIDNIQRKSIDIHNKIWIYIQASQDLEKSKKNNFNLLEHKKIQNFIHIKLYFYKQFLKKIKNKIYKKKLYKKQRRTQKRKKFLFNKILNSNKKLKKKNKLFNKNIKNNWYIPNYIEYDYKTLRGGFIRKPNINELVYTFNYSLKDLISYYKDKGF